MKMRYKKKKKKICKNFCAGTRRSHFSREKREKARRRRLKSAYGTALREKHKIFHQFLTKSQK